MNILALKDHLCLPDNENILVVPSGLAAKLGYIPAAILNQIHYWTRRCGKDYGTVQDHTTNPDRWTTEEIDVHFEDNENGFYSLKWIYNSVKEWTKQFAGFTYWQVRNGLQKLRDLGVLMFAQFGKSDFKRYGWYAINYPRLEELLGASQSIVEIPETLTQLDVRCTTNRDDAHHQSSYITEITNPKNNSQYNNSDDVLSEGNLDLEELREEKPVINPSADNKNQDLFVKPIIRHEGINSAAAPRDTTSPDAEINNQLVARLGVTLNPKLKRFLASVTVEEVLKGLAAYHYTLEVKEAPIESKTGFIIDSIKNNYIENTKMWMDSSETTQKFILLTAGAIAMGADLVGGFLRAMNTGEMLFVDKDGENKIFDFKLVVELLSCVGYKDTLSEMWKNYCIVTQ